MSLPKHYDNYWLRRVSKAELKRGFIKLKLDPYRVCAVLKIGGGAREQILKKAMRWTDKGDSEKKVIGEIMQACERRLQMLKEDGE